MLVAWGHDAHDEDKDESFEAVVERIVRAARENLRPLKASRIEMHPSMHYWYEVTDTIPGASMCRIYEHPRMMYKCEWKSPAAYENVVTQLAKVLGSEEWTLKTLARSAVFEPSRAHRNGSFEVRRIGSGMEVLVFPVVRD